MSYIVFARKWRPQTFEDVVGQDNIVTTLKNSIKSNRLAHAYIFAGPRGVGKTSLARILAKALNCQKGPALNPCNKCSSCIEVTEARSLDVIEIDGASNRGIEEIRTLRENVKFSPAHGKYKIYIIDEVHMLTTEAFNALLKTLEEPPAHVKFIFATTQPKKILSTILSRCHFFEFRRISNVKIIERLKEIAVSEKLKAGEDVFLAVAKASDGSLRDAESILDELVSFTNGDIRIKDVNSILGVVEQEYLFEITDKIIRKDAVGALNLLDELIDHGKDPNQLLINLIEHFRNMMVAKVISQNHEKLLDLPKDICEVISMQAKEITLDDIFMGFNAFLNAQDMSKRIESLRIPLEIALVKLSSQGKKQEGSHSGHKMERSAAAEVVKADKPKINANAPEIEVQDHVSAGGGHSVDDPPNSNEIHIELGKIKELWPNFLEKLTKIKVSAAHYLERGKPVKMSGGVLTIGFSKKSSFHKEGLERKENHLILEKIWKDILREQIKISFIYVSEEEAAGDPVEEAVDPLVQSALETFNGRVVRRE